MEEYKIPARKVVILSSSLHNAVAAPPPSLDEIIERVATLFGIEATTLPHGMEIWSNTPADAACYNSNDNIHEIIE